MKNQKGITLVSIVIYVLAMIIVVGITANITKYFYQNLSNVTDGVSDLYEYTTFNAYFSEDINIYGNKVKNCDGNSIQFSNNNNKYSYNQSNKSIYFNSIKICTEVDKCIFEVSDDNVIKVQMQIGNKEYQNSYTITNVKY